MGPSAPPYDKVKISKHLEIRKKGTYGNISHIATSLHGAGSLSVSIPCQKSLPFCFQLSLCQPQIFPNDLVQVGLTLSSFLDAQFAQEQSSVDATPAPEEKFHAGAGGGREPRIRIFLVNTRIFSVIPSSCTLASFICP